MTLEDVEGCNAHWAKVPPAHVQLARIGHVLGLPAPEPDEPREEVRESDLAAMIAAANRRPEVIGG